MICVVQELEQFVAARHRLILARQEGPAEQSIRGRVRQHEDPKKLRRHQHGLEVDQLRREAESDEEAAAMDTELATEQTRL
eukprot:12896451-Prorocentrum_lima.AAC.1